MRPSIFEIFKIYFLIGLQLIGGGYVIFPLLKKHLVEKRGYLTEEELVEYLSISQCLPGIIALNISIFSGYKLRKLKGVFAAVLGLLIPSFLIILLIANFVSHIANNQIAKYAFFGIRVSIVILIFFMILDIFAKMNKTIFAGILFFIVLFTSLYTDFSPTLIVILSIIMILLKGVKND